MYENVFHSMDLPNSMVWTLPETMDCLAFPIRKYTTILKYNYI